MELVKKNVKSQIVFNQKQDEEPKMKSIHI